MTRPCLFLAGLLAGIALPAAALDFPAETRTVSTRPFQVTQDVEFPFKNNTAHPVRLLDLQTSCDCLDAKVEPKVYAPGASGVIRARFTIGDRAGLYERTISVVTDESTPAIRLLVRIEVPEITAVAPRSLTWALRAPTTEKVVEVTPAPGLEITFTEAQATNGAFAARLETVVAGKHYRVHLTPLTTATPASAAIRIFGRDATGHDVVASAYANVE